MSLERVTDQDLRSDGLLHLEHEHRYRWAAKYANGIVLDAACGTGLLAKHLLVPGSVERYLGLDISFDATSDNSLLGQSLIEFITASVDAIPIGSRLIDTVVSLETMEHVENIADVLDEFSRVLKPTGILLGSVPSSEKERFNNDTWSQNPYHVNILDFDTLDSELKKRFGYVYYFIQRIECMSAIFPIDQGENSVKQEKLYDTDKHRELGSLMFIAANRDLANIVDTDEYMLRGPEFNVTYAALSKPIYLDRDLSHRVAIDRFEIMSQQEKMVNELIADRNRSHELAVERFNIIQEQSRLIAELRDQLASSTGKRS